MHAGYPFVPKTALALRTGDYWPVQRRDGDFGFCVYLDRWANRRVGFAAGLLDLVTAASTIPRGGLEIPVLKFGYVHVKVISASSSTVVGNVAGRLNGAEVAVGLSSLSAKHVVWGYGVPRIIVNHAAARVRA